MVELLLDPDGYPFLTWSESFFSFGARIIFLFLLEIFNFLGQNISSLIYLILRGIFLFLYLEDIVNKDTYIHFFPKNGKTAPTRMSNGPRIRVEFLHAQ